MSNIKDDQWWPINDYFSDVVVADNVTVRAIERYSPECLSWRDVLGCENKDEKIVEMNESKDTSDTSDKGDSPQANNVGTSNRGRWRMVDAILPLMRDAFKEIEENNEKIY